MSFVITQNFSLVGRQVCLKCPILPAGCVSKTLVRAPVVITKQLGPATYEVTGNTRYGLLRFAVKRDAFILPPANIEQEPIWGEDDYDGFVYAADSGFVNPFAKQFDKPAK